VGKTVTGIRIALAALLCAPLIAYSAGLGRLTVNSTLGQPLNAEIEIVSLQAGEEDALTARLASVEAFRQAGIELNSALISLQFAVDKRGSRPVIRLTTVQPVNEPFLDVLIELQWATGRLVREYTFLLDPPQYRGPGPVAAAPAAAPAAKPAAEPAAAKPASRAEARPLVSEPPGAGAKQEEVKKGDTLGAIARKNKPDGVTLNQMLIALFRANQAAFIRGNINRVRAGRILNVPDREEIVAINSAEANQLVQSQMADFAEYKRRLGAAVAAAPAAPVREREVTGRITAKPEASAPAEQKDQLRLSKVDPAKPAAPASRAAREDDRVARERALKDSQSRVGDLEKNVSDLQKLLEMKNQQLAELEKKASAKPAAPAPAPAAPAPAAKAPEPAKPAAEAPKPPAEAPKAAPEAAKEAPKEAVKEVAKEAPKEAAKEAPKAAAKEAPKPGAEAAKAKPKAAPAKAPAPEKSFFEDFIEDPIALGGLGVVVLLLAGYGAYAWRRKKASQTQFQDSVLGAASAPGAASVFSNAAAQPAGPDTPPPAAAAAQASEVSVSGVSVGGAESDEVDPIAEADVYMAYGRDAQAEEILKEALGKDANRIAVHAKLLEIYANRKDAKSFEQSALKVKSLANGAGPEWDKAMALGHSIDPGNGLYGSGGAAAAEAAPEAAAAPAAAPSLDFDIGGGDAAAGAGEGKAASGLDFDLGATAAIPKSDFAAGGTLKIDTKDVQGDTGGGLDFDLGGAADDGEKTMLLTPAKAPAPAKADPDATVAMDFDLNLDVGGAKAEPAKAAEAPLDLGGLSFDLGAPGGAAAPGGADPKWQEVATKLDLAKAYQEMGDKDGARELLNEVVKEGDAAQQGQAQQMLSSLG
jgi:pilus assembly protein FimV